METLTARLLTEIERLPIIDVHTHIDPRKPTAGDFDDLLGYHPCTELAHSAGMGRELLRSEVPAEERAREIARFLPAIENTTAYSWLLELATELFGFRGDRIDATNIDALSRAAERVLHQGGWEESLLYRWKVEKVFLTSSFDDPLEGFDADRYVPCLRVDPLVFRLGDPAVVERLRQSSRCDVGNAAGLRNALDAAIRRFAARGARSCSISLPPEFQAVAREASSVDPLIRRILGGEEVTEREASEAGGFVLWMIAELCREHRLSFQLKVGVRRNAYRGGVHHGRDLPSRATSLDALRELFNAFPEVRFPVSVLSSEGNQELAAYGWLFPNVFPSGHWWYADVPSLVERDARARLQMVPRPKLIGYYSDAHKLEFVGPKFSQYRRVLARILAADFVIGRRWSEEKALGLARDILHDNAERIFQLQAVEEGQR